MLHKGVLVMAGVKLNFDKKKISINYEKIGNNKLLLKRIFDAIKHMFSTKDEITVKKYCETLKLNGDSLDKIKAYEALKKMSGMHEKDYKVMLEDNNLILSIAGKNNQKIEERITLTDGQQKILSICDDNDLIVAFKQLHDINITKLNDNPLDKIKVYETLTEMSGIHEKDCKVMLEDNNLILSVVGKNNQKIEERITLTDSQQKILSICDDNDLIVAFKQLHDFNTKFDDFKKELEIQKKQLLLDFSSQRIDVVKSFNSLKQLIKNPRDKKGFTIDVDFESFNAQFKIRINSNDTRTYDMSLTSLSIAEKEMFEQMNQITPAAPDVLKSSSNMPESAKKMLASALDAIKSLPPEQMEKTITPVPRHEIDRNIGGVIQSQSAGHKTSPHSVFVDYEKSRARIQQFLNDTPKDKKGMHVKSPIEMLKTYKKKRKLYEILIQDNAPLEKIKAYKELREMGEDKNKYEVWLKDKNLILSKTRKNKKELNIQIPLTGNEQKLLPMYDNSKLLDAFEQMDNIRTKIADLDHEINKQQTEETSDSKIASLRNDIIESFNYLKKLTKDRKDRNKFNLNTSVEHGFAELRVSVDKTNIVKFTMSLSGIDTEAEAESFRKKSGLNQSEDIQLMW